MRMLPFLLLMLTGSAEAGECVKRSPCSCQAEEGIVDLSSLASQVEPAFKDVLGDDGMMYSYNPCHAFTENTSTAFDTHCKDVAACQVISAGGVQQFFDSGTQESVRFFTTKPYIVMVQNLTDKDVAIAFYTSSDSYRQTEVVLVCNEQDQNTTFTALGLMPFTKVIYRFILKSPACCFVPSNSSPTQHLDMSIFKISALIIMMMKMVNP